jgi:hypothetical protein
MEHEFFDLGLLLLDGDLEEVDGSLHHLLLALFQEGNEFFFGY